MDERRYWDLIESIWQGVDSGALVAALSRGESSAGIVDRYRHFLAALVARLDALPFEDARSLIDRHCDCIRALDLKATRDAVCEWMYGDIDGDSVAVIPLLGEAFYRRVVSSPDAAAVLGPADGLGALGGWRALAKPAGARFRAALFAEIPACFADVAYPGDADVISSDWATDEECRYFCGKDWRSIERSTLYRRYADLSFVKPRGFHYLLPAFLLAALEDPDDIRACGPSITGSLLFTFSRGEPRNYVALLSMAQRRAVADVLRLHHGSWRCGPIEEPDPDLVIALKQLDPKST